MNDLDYIIKSIKINDDELTAYVDQLLTLGWIEEDSAAEGIAKKFVHEGSHGMSEKQIYSLARHGILPHFYSCGICRDKSWEQMSFIEDYGFCSQCYNLLQE